MKVITNVALLDKVSGGQIGSSDTRLLDSSGSNGTSCGSDGVSTYTDAMGNVVNTGSCSPDQTMVSPGTQTVEITGTKMTQEEKDAFDNEMTQRAIIIDNCAQGSPACLPGLWDLYQRT